MLTALVLGAGITPAQAHDALVSSSPASGAVLPTAPSVVELDFTGTPLPLGTEVLVVGPAGDPVSVGAAEIRDTTVVQALAESLPAGGYSVEWRSTSSDGHALTGTSEFTVTAGAAAAATTEPTAATPAPKAATTDTTTASVAQPTAGGLPAGWLVVAVLGVGALGTLVVLRLRRRV